MNTQLSQQTWFLLISLFSIINTSSLYYQTHVPLTHYYLSTDRFLSKEMLLDFSSSYSCLMDIPSNDMELITIPRSYINGLIIKNFPFSICEARSDSQTLNGVIGLGFETGPDGIAHNSFIDLLKEKRVIKKRTIFINFAPFFTQIKFRFNKMKKELEQFHFCSRTELRNDWHCIISYIQIGDDLLPQPRFAFAKFKPESMFNKLSYDSYFKTFSSRFDFKSGCGTEYLNGNSSEIMVLCETPKDIQLTFIIEDFGIPISPSLLFNKINQTHFAFSFVFINDSSIHSDDEFAVEFGYPFFLENEISLDFDNNQIGLKGKELYSSYIDEYLDWKSKIFLGEAETFLYMLAWIVVIASMMAICWYCYNECKLRARSMSPRDINQAINA